MRQILYKILILNFEEVINTEGYYYGDSFSCIQGKDTIKIQSILYRADGNCHSCDIKAINELLTAQPSASLVDIVNSSW
jgi:hypothetical protein